VRYIKLFENMRNPIPSYFIVRRDIILLRNGWGTKSDYIDNVENNCDISRGSTFVFDSNDKESKLHIYSDKHNQWDKAEFKPYELNRLADSGSVELYYDVPQSLITFVEEYLIYLIDEGLKVYYERKDFNNVRSTYIKIGNNFDWEKFGDGILSFYEMLSDKYNIRSISIQDNRRISNKVTDFINCEKPSIISSILFEINY